MTRHAGPTLAANAVGRRPGVRLVRGGAGRGAGLPGSRAGRRPRRCRAMTPMTSIIVIVVLAIIGVYISWRAGRLDRLHARLEAARFALDAALVRRSSVALELASSGLLDPATSVLLAGAAHDARSARGGPGAARERPDQGAARRLQPARLPRPAGRPGGRGGAAQRAGERFSSGVPGPEVLQRRGGRNAGGAAAVAGVGCSGWPAGRPNPEFFEIDDSLVPVSETGGLDRRPPAPDHLAVLFADRGDFASYTHAKPPRSFACAGASGQGI